MPKDLSRFQVGSCTVLLGGRSFTIPAPSGKRGLALAKIFTMGLAAFSDPERLNEDTLSNTLGEEIMQLLTEDDGMDRLCLGDKSYTEMFEAGIPNKDISMTARYAAYFFIFDEATADKAMETELQSHYAEPLPSYTDVELPKL